MKPAINRKFGMVIAYIITFVVVALFTGDRTLAAIAGFAAMFLAYAE